MTASAALAVSSLLLPTAEAAPPVSPLAPVGASKDVAVSETGSYVVLLQDDAAAISVGREQLATAAGVAEMAELEHSHDQVLADHGLAGVEPTNEYTAVLNGFSARLDHAAAERLTADPRVAMVLPDYLRQPMSLTAGGNHGGKGASDPLVEFLGLTGKHGAYAKGITGEGVIVGVIDTGIWPENPMFADDGTLPPAPELDETERSACDFGSWAVSAPPLEYSIDSWVVPSAPGNLTVTAAPPAAEIGVEGVVSVAWSGLSAPGRWFGAVAHTDGESVLDQTVVEVTVPPAAP